MATIPIDHINRLDDDSLLLIFNEFICPKQIIPLGLVCKRWNRLIDGRFCRQVIKLRIHDYDTDYDSVEISEHKLLAIATKFPNVRCLILHCLRMKLSPEGADRLAQLWPLAHEIDLSSSAFSSEVFGHLVRHFPHLKSIYVNNVDNLEVQHFDILFNNHPNLINFEYFGYGTEGNFIRSLNAPLESFSMAHILDAHAVLDVLEAKCQHSLQSIDFCFEEVDKEESVVRRILSTFPQLRNLSLSLFNFKVLQKPDLPVLHRLQKVSLIRLNEGKMEDTIEFLKSYPQLIDLHISECLSTDDLAEELVNALPNLESLKLPNNKLTSVGLMKLTRLKKLNDLKLGHCFHLTIDDLCAFVRCMPGLERLRLQGEHFKLNLLIKALRNEMRSCESVSRLWMTEPNHVLQFLVDSSTACTDEAIDEFSLKLEKYFEMPDGYDDEIDEEEDFYDPASKAFEYIMKGKHLVYDDDDDEDDEDDEDD